MGISACVEKSRTSQAEIQEVMKRMLALEKTVSFVAEAHSPNSRGWSQQRAGSMAIAQAARSTRGSAAVQVLAPVRTASQQRAGSTAIAQTPPLPQMARFSGNRATPSSDVTGRQVLTAAHAASPHTSDVRSSSGGAAVPAPVHAAYPHTSDARSSSGGAAVPAPVHAAYPHTSDAQSSSGGAA